MSDSKLDTSLRLTNWTAHAVGAIATLALVGLGHLFLLRPERLQREELHQDIEHYQRLVEQGSAVQRGYNQLSKKREELRDRIALAEKRLPHESGEVAFLKELNRAATVAGVALEDYRPGKITPHGNLSRMEIGIVCSGTYAEICSFFDQLTRLERLTRVEGFEVLSRNEADRCEGNVTLWIFYGAKPLASDNEGAPHA